MKDALEVAVERAAEKRRQQKVRMEERERCAKIAEERAAQWHRGGLHQKANEAAAIAADIRR